MKENVVLVDEKGNAIGFEEKIEAHRQAKLHMAFSIFVFNSKGELLLQKRNKAKYHSGGLWANTCCSHPRPGEAVLEAAHRRLKEEMGFDCELEELFSFVYTAKLDNGLTEHEYNHVITGKFSGRPNVNPEEVEDWKWVTLEELSRGMSANPGNYSYWLKAAFNELLIHLNSKAAAEKAQSQPADFFSYKHREDIERAMHDFLPSELTAEWVERVVGKTLWQHDTEAMTKAISEPVWDLLNRGGKRLRPMLMLLCCEAVGGKPESIVPFTVIPEIIHNGTLIADDIEDNSELRRGKPAVHRIFGTDVAINASSTMYLLPMTIIRDSALPAEMKLEAYNIISTKLIKCSFGQAIDIYWHSGKSDKVPTEQEYLQMCANKSGSLASMAAQLGALLGGGSEVQVEALGRFAEAAGAAFQIKDDILNIEDAGGIGKEFGDDITEGKRTLLVIHTLNTATAAEKKKLLQILNSHAKDKSIIAEAIAIIKKHGSVEYAKKAAEQLLEKAWEEADAVLPESEAKSQLKGFAQMLINRTV